MHQDDDDNNIKNEIKNKQNEIHIHKDDTLCDCKTNETINHENTGMNLIEGDWLYLGCEADAKDFEQLQAHGITHVLIVGACMREQFPKDFSYQKCEIKDDVSAIIYTFFAPSIEFLDYVKSTNGRVLVHCEQGISRSATLVIAYLMYLNRPTMTFKEAMDRVRSIRPQTCPNAGFRAQLQIFEECGSDPNEKVKSQVLLRSLLKTKTRESVPKSIFCGDIFSELSDSTSYEIGTSQAVDSTFVSNLIPQRFMVEKKNTRLSRPADDAETLLQTEQNSWSKSEGRKSLFSSFIVNKNCECNTNAETNSLPDEALASLGVDRIEDDDGYESMDSSYSDNCSPPVSLHVVTPLEPLSAADQPFETHSLGSPKEFSTGRSVLSGCTRHRKNPGSAATSMIDDTASVESASGRDRTLTERPQEQSDDDTMKGAATTVVGKVLLGYEMTPADEKTVAEWLNNTNKHTIPHESDAFLGLRQALRMMRIMVRCQNSHIRLDDKRNGQLELHLQAVQTSLLYIYTTLGKFTGLQVMDESDQSQLLKLLRSEDKVDQILAQLQLDFTAALKDFHDNVELSESIASDLRTPLKPRAGSDVIVEHILSNVVNSDVPATVPENEDEESHPILHRAATIDILLLFAKLGLRHNNDLSDKTYMRFSQMLEGGSRSKDALKRLDNSTAIELLGYLESLPGALKTHARLQRLVGICEARLIIMVNEESAASICDQLASLRNPSLNVRRIISYTLHFSSAVIGTKIIQRLERDGASSRIAKMYRAHYMRQLSCARRRAAHIIQSVWRYRIGSKRSMDDSEDVLDGRERRTVSVQNRKDLFDGLDGGYSPRQYNNNAQSPKGHSPSTSYWGRNSDERRKSQGITGKHDSISSREENYEKRKTKLRASLNLGAVRRFLQKEPFSKSPRKGEDLRTFRNEWNSDLGFHEAVTAWEPREDADGLNVHPDMLSWGYNVVASDSLRSSDAMSVGSYATTSTNNETVNAGSGEATRPISCTQALQGLLKHLSRILMSEMRDDMKNADSYHIQKLSQLQNHAKSLRLVHPRICVSDTENRLGLSRLPKANSELYKYLKQHPFGMNQTPYVFDFELGVLSLFPPCEFDAALQPPNDTSAKFRKILGTVFDLMPPTIGGTQALLQITETATLSQHASAGYALTICLHHLDQLYHQSESKFLTNHVLGDEQANVSGTVAGGYVRYDSEKDLYVFTEESGHYGVRWSRPGTRKRFNDFMRESNLEGKYILKPYYRALNAERALSDMFNDEVEDTPPSVESTDSRRQEPVRKMSTVAENNSSAKSDDSDWDFD